MILARIIDLTRQNPRDNAPLKSDKITFLFVELFCFNENIDHLTA